MADERRTLILTGASQGIGHATVKRFSAAGWRVITASRRAFSEDCPWEAGPEDHIRIDLSDASPFFTAAWEACSSIPPGETRSYQWLAEAAGSPKASRAAGQAMARNPLPLIIPCHRVVGSNGGLHGYGGGGVGVKARLLELERQQKLLL